jgi:arylformamidase
MKAELQWHRFNLHIDFSAGNSLAITLDPHGPQPSFFAPAPARSSPLRHGDYIGDIDLGGSCNAEVLEFAPHCHGTHTECRSHIDNSGGHVLDIIDQQPCLARLVSLNAVHDGNEITLTLEGLQEQLGQIDNLNEAALLIRTLPNSVDKCSRDYALEPAYPVLSSEAMQWLSAQNLKHLLIDTPSLDQADDGGRLTNHRRWWGLDDAFHNSVVGSESRSVTEMIYVPNEVPDGYYWMHLELQPLAADATSSRPVIYPIQIISGP